MILSGKCIDLSNLCSRCSIVLIGDYSLNFKSYECIVYMYATNLVELSSRYCKDCVSPYQAQEEAFCPECRGAFDPQDLRRAVDLEHAMRSVQVSCPWCGQVVSMKTPQSLPLQAPNTLFPPFLESTVCCLYLKINECVM